MKNNNIISIVVPVYNAQSTIANTISSILNQNYTSIEVVIINDGSTDNTSFLCNKLAAQDSRIVYKEITNSGPAHARNVGINLATGDYLAFVDADDTVEPEMYSVMCEFSISNELDITCCGYNEVRSGIRKKVNVPFEKAVLDSSESRNILHNIYYNENLNGLGSLWNKLYKRSFLMSNGLEINEALVRGEDYWFNFEAFKYSPKFGYIESALYNYHVDSLNSVMKSFRLNQFEAFVYDYKVLAKNYTNEFDWDKTRVQRRFYLDVLEYLYLLLGQDEDYSVKFESIVLSKDFIECERSATRLTMTQRICSFLVRRNQVKLLKHFIKVHKILKAL